MKLSKKSKSKRKCILQKHYHYIKIVSKSIELSKMIVMTMSNLNMDGARFDIKIEQDEIEESYIKLDGKNVRELKRY